MDNSTEPMLETLAISYNDNQLVDQDFWNVIFAPILLLGIKTFLSSDVSWQPLDTKSNSSTTSKSHRRDI